jgi:hypothetical protein
VVPGIYVKTTKTLPRNRYNLKAGNSIIRDTSSPLMFGFILEYTIGKAQGNKGGMEMNGTHQFLVIADVTLLGEGKYHKGSHKSCIIR